MKKMTAFADNRRLDAIDMAFYRFAEKCFSEGLDAIFKGGCLLRHILRSTGGSDLRKTKDIDFDISEESYLRLEDEYRSLLKFGKLRDSRDGSSLMTNVVLFDGGYDCDVCILSSMDLKIVQVYHGINGDFYGVRLEDMVADKISSMSSEHIVGRAKDITDIYSVMGNRVMSLDMELLWSLLCKRNIDDFRFLREKRREISNIIEELGFNSDEVLRVSERFVFGFLEDKWRSKNWNGSVWI